MAERELNTQDLDCLMRGACFLGSGGGGSLSMASQVKESLLGLPPVKMVDPEDLPDDAALCFVAGVGAPTAEGKPFLQSPLNSVRALETLSGKSFDYVIPGETGAMNSLLPLLAAAQSGNRIRLINADGAGRALPQLKMCTYALKGVPCSPSVIANEDDITLPLFEENPDALDTRIREIIGTNPNFKGAAILAAFMMPGASLKQRDYGVPGSLETTIAVGKALLLENQDARTAALRSLFDHQDRCCHILSEGQITFFESRQQEGFDVGTVTIKPMDRSRTDFIEVDFVNENIAARFHRNEGVYSLFAPIQFCYLSPEGMPFSNAELSRNWTPGSSIPVTFTAVSPAPEIDNKTEAAYFAALYQRFFPAPDKKMPRDPEEKPIKKIFDNLNHPDYS